MRDQCTRCEGTGHVSAFLYDDGYGPIFGDIDCPRCGGGGHEPTPEQKAEAAALYGAEGLEYY